MEKVDYAKTLNLPNTSFPMRGNLPEREPFFLKKFDDDKIYEKVLKKNKESGKTFILHDGPPYANGNIHMGHSLNKVVKDIIVRYKTMNGFYAPYVPGWDTHGLPIEKKVQQEKNTFVADVGEYKFRKICETFAKKAIENQAKQFKRLGGLGDYQNNRYYTFDEEFEASQIEVFWDMYKKGFIYRDLKPVYWCSDCNTALAEAEIEYHDHDTTSIYVKFAIKDDKGILSKFGKINDMNIVIWTTTPWTLPGNMAVTLNPEFEYVVLLNKDNNEIYIFAKELVEKVVNIGNITNYEVLGEVVGKDLEGVTLYKPLDNTLESRVILGSDNDLYVSLDAGTGAVHTAPGHGHEDYLACKRYKDIEIIVPVDDKGVMTEEAGEFNGLKYTDANKAIITKLEQTGRLFGKAELSHQYPHCWRCKEPVIYRATTQWFASVEGFRDEVLEEIKKVKWYPSWGQERMTNMIKDRADWCISRQRVWGVPIPIFYCEECGHELINEKTIERIKTLVNINSTNMWFDLSSEQILKELAVCDHCGCTKFKKETDIMDVWFDSGSTHKAVMENSKYNINQDVADLYLEGNDQYRGWFQSSLLTSVATKGKAPYKQILTHGMVVDGSGRKMSKSLGNGIDPLEIINKYGADILRLWCISADYKSDVRISDDILKQVAEVYKKIRNTLRFLLGNTNDFNTNTDYVKFEDREEIDKYMMHKLNMLVEEVTEAYEEYDFHTVYTLLHKFCTMELSSKYLDVMKDILYTFNINHKLRRSCQSTMMDILNTLVKLISPILCFTADEIWSFMKHNDKNESLSVVLSSFPSVNNEYEDCSELITKWDKIYELKDRYAKDLEIARASKTIGNSLDALITITTKGEDYDFIKENLSNIKLVTIVSEVELKEGEDNIFVEKAYGDKCARCWTYSSSVGRNMKHEDLCDKCINNM